MRESTGDNAYCLQLGREGTGRVRDSEMLVRPVRGGVDIQTTEFCLAIVDLQEGRTWQKCCGKKSILEMVFRTEGLDPGDQEHRSKAVNTEVMTACLEEPF